MPVTSSRRWFVFQESADGVPSSKHLKKIIILTDEAHRTQYGTLGAAINTGLPNAPKIAFTGTPLIKTKRINNEFGAYIIPTPSNNQLRTSQLYSFCMKEESQMSELWETPRQSLDEYFSDKTEEEKAEIKRNTANKAILKHPNVLKESVSTLKNTSTNRWHQMGLRG